jgi:FMN phosphatase YigB (HAD superfamily)
MLTKLGVSQFIRNSYISQEIGLEKPDVRFYQHFLTSENVQPGEVLYVGDSPELDWVPARKVGLTCLIISEFLTPQFGTKLKPFLIENLNEVKGYFPDNSKI